MKRKIKIKGMSLKEIEDKGIELNNCLHYLISVNECSASKYINKCRNKPVCSFHYQDFKCKKFK